MSTRQSRLDKKDTRKSPKNDNDESVDDLLANVDQFIEGVYRDLSISPPRRSSMDNSTMSNVRRSLDSNTSSSAAISPAGPSSFQSATTRREEAPVSSPVTRRNMDAEIDRINRICDNVDQNLRSIGLFMNGSTPNNMSESLSCTNRSSPTSSPSIIIVNNTTPEFPSMFGRMRLQLNSPNSESSSRETAAEQIVDLSNSQTESPETFRRPVVDRQNYCDDDDVILVSADIPSVVDLCTPVGYQEVSRPRNTIHYDNLNRRRLHQFSDEEDSCCAGPSSRRKRYSNPSFNSLENISPSVNETAPATTDTGRTPFMCPVCMDSCLQRQPTSTICGHVFCKMCIEQAITLTRKCPLCNKKITKKQTFRIYF